MMSGPCALCTTGSPCMFPEASFSGRGSHFWAFLFLHMLHQDHPLFVLEHLSQLWVLTPYVCIQIIVCCYVFALCSIWLLPLLIRLSTPTRCNLGVRHPLTNLAILALGRQQCQLLMQAVVITVMTTPQRALMLSDNNGIITTTVCVVQPIVFPQHDDFVSIAGQLMALLNDRLLVCSNSTSMLCGHQKTVFQQINGSDKLEYYTHSLRS